MACRGEAEFVSWEMYQRVRDKTARRKTQEEKNVQYREFFYIFKKQWRAVETEIPTNLDWSRSEFSMFLVVMRD